MGEIVNCVLPISQHPWLARGCGGSYPRGKLMTCGGGALPYLAYMGMCCWTGSWVLNRVYNFTIEHLEEGVFLTQSLNPLTPERAINALPNEVYILSQKRPRKANDTLCGLYEVVYCMIQCQSVFRPFGLTFWQYFLVVLMITFKNGIRHKWGWSKYIRSTGF